MKHILLLLICLYAYAPVFGQLSGSLMQHPDVSATQVCFAYGDDLWIAPKSGGPAMRLSSPEGIESYPRFSPDGTKIAYSANYHGNIDVYVIEAKGGIPKRLTFYDTPERVLGWTPDGKSVLFASMAESGRVRFNQFYTVSTAGGTPTKLPVPYGEFASYSPDGGKMVFTELSRVNRNWKRYRGGTAPDLITFDLTTFEAQNITQNAANDEMPMWIGDVIYYMSDAGPKKRNNLWKYDPASRSHEQLTFFEDYDITFPEGGPSDIVFEAGGKLYLHELSSGATKPLEIQVVSDQKALISQQKTVNKYIQNATLSPDGNRVVIEARGDLFDLPAGEGFVSNLTASSGSAERYPQWSPDGQSLAYWSDAGGEYQLVIADMTGTQKTRTLTQFTHGYRYQIYWSPDSKKIAFVDQAMDIYYMDISTGKITKIDNGRFMFEGSLRSFAINWSPDSQWIVYARYLGNQLTSALFTYHIASQQLSQLTSGFYADNSPVFSADGKHLFYTTNRSLSPVYSDLDNTFIYPNTTQIAVGTLSAGTASLLAPKNDAYDMEEKSSAASSSKKKKADQNDKSDTISPTVIDVQGFENRVELIDVDPGSIGKMAAVEGKLLFHRFPNSGAPKKSTSSLDYYDIKERKVSTILSDISDFAVSADDKKVLVTQKQKLAVLDIKADQKIDKTVPTQQMTMTVTPMEEWRQIFQEVWRLERDYFYDPGMHGLDWNLMKTRYGQLIEQANTRNDVNLIIGDLIAELNASHTYNGGGDMEKAANMNVGYLGADLAVENGRFRIKKIITGAPWDVEAHSPLAQSGLNVNTGDYVLAVNGQNIDPTQAIHAAFQGLGKATVQLTVSSSPSYDNARKVVVRLLDSEARLRHLAWIDQNRRRVEAATGGKIGYVYVRSTGQSGQTELIRQYYGQLDKEGLIIDERFNDGGQIPDRFVELLNRKPLAYFAVRDGKDWAWPPAGNFGPKVMLINGFSGSGGDAFPDYFRKTGLGPLIGTRTWGGIIGISGAPTLIDNGGITVPTFRMYDPDGQWFKEGHGVDPDIEVIQDFQKLAQGIDTQLEAAIAEVMRLLNSQDQYKKPVRPAYELRNE